MIPAIALFLALEDPASWSQWSPREEIAPRMFMDRDGLVISGNFNAASYGGWWKRVDSIEPGAWYRLTAHYRAEAVPDEDLRIIARLNWIPSAHPLYAHRVEPLGDWKRVVIEGPAPPGATSAKLEFLLQNAPQGTVWWKDIRFEQIAPSAPRNVRVVAVNLRPQSSKTPVEKFAKLIEEKVSRGTDVILLPEGTTVIGTGKSYVDVSETTPGPATIRLGEIARAKHAYIAAGIYEREGKTVYNTAILLNREGRVAGKYRKVYLPRAELDAGLTPGNDYPVFRTDFGKVGLMICWDIQYPDPARAMALRGAEILLVPIWGGDETLAKARAIENHLYLATSGYGIPTYIMDPIGEILAMAKENGSTAAATIDLNKHFPQKYLGDMRGVMRKELRTGIEVDPR